MTLTPCLHSGIPDFNVLLINPNVMPEFDGEPKTVPESLSVAPYVGSEPLVYDLNGRAY